MPMPTSDAAGRSAAVSDAVIVEKLCIVRVWHEGDDFRVIRHPGNRRPIVIRVECNHPASMPCPYEAASPYVGGAVLRAVPWIAVTVRVLEAMALDLLARMGSGDE